MQSISARLRTAEKRPWPTQPIPIAFVITVLEVGGAEKAMTALVTRLDRARWSPRVICLGAEAPLAPVIREKDIPVVCLGLDRRRPINALKRLRREFSRVRPDLIQSFLFHANFLTKCAAIWAGRPWVVGGIRVAERQQRWHLNFDRWTQRLSVGAVCVSAQVADFTRTEGKIAADRLVVIPNGVVTTNGTRDRVDRHTLGLPRDGRILLCVGRIVIQKGVSLLLDAFRAIAEANPSWSLVLVGEGSERSALEAETRSDPLLADRVQWLGWRPDVKAIMAASDVLVLPSLWEGMPNVVLEAMAAGLPVVAANVEGVADLVTTQGPEASGWIFRPGDSGDLSRVLSEVLANTQRYAELGSNGRLRVSRDYSWDHVVRQYEELWAGLLGRALPVSGGTRHDS